MAFGVTDRRVSDLLGEQSEMTPEQRESYRKEKMPSDGHLVEYAEECVRHSKEVYKDRTDKDTLLWEAHETMMRENRDKESYQSKIATNEPFTTAMQAKMLVRRAVMDHPEYFTITPRKPNDQASQDRADFQQKALKYWTGTKDANVRRVYPAMCDMGFSTGISMAVKALWGPDRNGIDHLRHAMIPPWLIHRDPDAKPQEPQSGLYCIHQDYVDRHILQAGANAGYFSNMAKVFTGTERQKAWSEEELAKKRGQVLGRNRFRKAALVTEFWGDVLDENGELVLTNQTYTAANGAIIRPTIGVKFPTLRWPIHQFSPLPSILDFHGYGLYEGVLLIWKLRNNLLNLTIDNENWRINKAFEVDLDKLMNPADTELYPGAIKVRKRGATEGPAYTAIETPQALEDLKVLWELTANLFTNGSFVTELLKGEMGERKDITAHEVDLKIKQGLGVFDGIGKDVELGGIQLLEMDREVIFTYWDDYDRPDYAAVFGNDPVYLRLAPGLMPEQRWAELQTDTEIRMSGVSELFEKSEMLDRLKAAVFITDMPRFAGMTKDYDLLQRIFHTLGVYDILLTKDELQQKAILEQQTMMRDAVSGAVESAAAAGGLPSAQPAAGPAKPAGKPAASTKPVQPAKNPSAMAAAITPKKPINPTAGRSGLA